MANESEGMREMKMKKRHVLFYYFIVYTIIKISAHCINKKKKIGLCVSERNVFN